ncbi:MAG: dephospho-CoA kinase [Spirochaetes bacterium]|nr:dephospho-CoA kinase [Spirochaetota bacterium]
MIIGITGKVAAGKDSVLSILKDYIEYDICLDIDKIGNYFFQLKVETIVKKFNLKTCENIKKNLRKIVFSNKGKMNKLEKILHPNMKKFVKRILNENEKNGRVIIINCALLHKMKFNRYCDNIIIVDSNREKRLERLISRNMIEFDEAEKIIDFHEKYHFLNEKKIEKLKIRTRNKLFFFSDEKKANYFIINNNGTYDQLRENVELIWKNLIEIN